LNCTRISRAVRPSSLFATAATMRFTRAMVSGGSMTTGRDETPRGRTLDDGSSPSASPSREREVSEASEDRGITSADPEPKGFAMAHR
jgi:hypothetical protein